MLFKSHVRKAAATLNCSLVHVVVVSCNRFTARITELMKVLKELNTGKYERTMVTQQDKGKETCSRTQTPVLSLLCGAAG